MKGNARSRDFGSSNVVLYGVYRGEMSISHILFFYQEYGPFEGSTGCIWVVVKIMVPFWVPSIVRHLIFRVPKKGA